MFDENNGKLVLVADYLKVPDALVAENYGLSIHAARLKKVRVENVYSCRIIIALCKYRQYKCTSGSR